MTDKKNAGLSLIEVIVVIAIMAVMIGMTGIGISLMFSRDAEKCATAIEGGLDKARTYSMSKPGTWYIEVKEESTDGNVYMTIWRDDTPNDGDNYEIYEQENLGSRATLASGTVKIWFNSASGSVNKVEENGFLVDLSAVAITKIKLENSGNSSRSKTVNLVHVTGRHFLE